MVQRKFMVIKKLQRALTDKNKDEEGFLEHVLQKYPMLRDLMILKARYFKK